MPKRRKGTIAKEIRLTETGLDAIQAWAIKNDVSFSAAIETLARLGLGQSPGEALAPVMVSTLRREIFRSYDRLARLLVLNIIESGTATRMASAAVKTLRPEHYEEIKDAARTDARRAFAQSRTARLLDDLMREHGDGDREG